MIPFATNNAYNSFGGKSLYPESSSGARASNQVSDERPGASGFGPNTEDEYQGEYLFVRWATAHPEIARFDYATSTDIHADAQLLSHYKLVVLTGHDEYWSQGMRTQIEDFQASGGNILSMSGNTMYWRVSFGSSPTTKKPYSTMTCEKKEEHDHFYSDGGLGEEQILGATSRLGMWYGSGSFQDYTYRIVASSHWALRDTDSPGVPLKVGATLGGGGLYMIGYETDGVPDKDDDGVLEPNDPLFSNPENLPAFVSPPGLQVLASRYIHSVDHTRGGNVAMTIWRKPTCKRTNGCYSFSAGSMFWPRCLWNHATNTEQPWNAGMQVTINVIRRFTTP